MLWPADFFDNSPNVMDYQSVPLAPRPTVGDSTAGHGYGYTPVVPIHDLTELMEFQWIR